ncbi:hypothetical protein BLOT_008884 [Blomia tropicalis]|nr:hypothetical protein BLOT_008884 [Blomia tropicalis]
MASALNTNDEDELELVRARLIMVELQFALACPICSLAVDESSRDLSYPILHWLTPTPPTQTHIE